jgi:hypothetical protein
MLLTMLVILIILGARFLFLIECPSNYTNKWIFTVMKGVAQLTRL